MLSGKAQAATTPTALGSLLQAATYGLPIQQVYGMTISPLYAIWAANLRQGGSIKKFKQLKKGITAYVENIDFLLGKNPIIGVNQMWNNGATIPLELATFTQGGVGGGAITITVPPTPPRGFYSVIGVSVAKTYSVTFNDYGSSGPRTLSGTYQIPMWNELMTGPDPTHNSYLRNFPYCYRWQPSYGNVVFIDYPDFFTDVITIYYTLTTPATSLQGPLAHNRLAFEAQLGSGTEYSDAGLPGQQIIYPMFAGIGSSSIDLGSSGALPQLQAEVQGKFSLYSTGDADYADIIEDVIKSGLAQAAIGAGPATSQVEHGLSCYAFPGLIQIKQNASVESFTQGPQTYNLAVTEGNFLIVIGFTAGIGGSPVTISDSGSNSWTALFSTSAGGNVWYAQANASGVITVTVAGLGFDWHTCLMEVGGVDTIDSIVIANNNGGATVATTNVSGQPGYLLNIALYNAGGHAQDPVPQWNILGEDNIYGNSFNQGFAIAERIIQAPGNYTFTVSPLASLYGSVLIAFKNSQPPTYPKPFGDFIDTASFNLVRQQCRANGLFGSLAMITQKAASDWLKTLFAAADAAPIFLGFRLFGMPYSEVSAIGNGITYNAPTAGGPIFNLTTENGDFLAKSEDAPLIVKTAERVNQPNVLQMQCVNRDSNYNPSVVEQPDAASISLFGIRKADPIVNEAVQDVSIARLLLSIAVRQLQYGGDIISFTLPAKYCLLAPMGAGGGPTTDAVITVSDPLASIFDLPVRINSMEEQDDWSINCTAEPFIYGMYAPSLSASISGTDTPLPYQPSTGGAGGGIQINPPIIFEATPRLAAQNSPAQIWLVTSSGEPGYGGCDCYISTDGGLSYVPASPSPTVGSAMQATVGTTPDQNWPSGSDPDTTNNLFVSFSETLASPPGTLPSFSDTQRDNFQEPCYVGFNNAASSNIEFITGDTTQVTEIGALFSVPTILNALPSDAVIVNIFPMVALEAGPALSPITVEVFQGTGMTPTSGGSNTFGPTGPIQSVVPPGGGSGIGTTLPPTEEIRVTWTLNVTGPGASGAITGIGWAILYSSATPSIDPLTIIPFGAAPGTGWGWAIPKTVATGMVGTGTNATASASGGIAPTGIPYELMTYNEATLLSPGAYELMATGSGNELRRGVYGAPMPGVGMAHPFGSPFALLNPTGTGIFKINMDPAWINTQLWFKFPTFNTFGSLVSGLADVTAYPFTPTGIPGNIGPATGGILVNGS